MASSQEDEPKGSEVSMREWLEQIGATDICYVGYRGSTPDFSITYSGERIAVEVARLLPSVGWHKKTEIAFARELNKLIKEVSSDPCNLRWHSWCQYDSRDRCPPPSGSEAWKERARAALRTGGPGGEFQLLSTKKLKGRGIVLELHPAGNQGSFNGVSEDEGYGIEGTLVDRVVEWVDKKTCIVRKTKSVTECCRWWLVFDDEILVAPAGFLGISRQKIENDVRDRTNTELWSKIILVSRFQIEKPPPTQPKWFWSLWENPRHPALPESPC